MKRALIHSVGLASLLSCLMGAQGKPPTVTAGAEVLEGFWIGPGAAVFRGIPYAAAPVGDLRWRPPAPHRPRNGPQSAQSFSAVCVQTERLTAWEKSIATVFGTQDQVDATPRNTNEDCLYLNVWTNNLGGKTPQPVMVWVHGGSNVAGEGSSPWYDGSELAKRGVVLVTINYRLGVFGFLALPALSAESPDRVSGNYALLDQLAALRWVRANIKQFGGDPGRVTIFGESAGSLDLVALMASPLSAGLFHRAIAQSGAPMGAALPLAQAEAQGTALIEAAGIDPTSGAAVALRRKPAAELLDLADRQMAAGRLQIQPVIDGWVLPDAAGRIFSSGKQRQVPLMIGSNAREMTTLRSFLPRIERTVTAYRGWLRQTVGADAERFGELYPAQSDADVEGALIDATTESLFTCRARFAARAMARIGVPAYLYQFTRVRPRGQSLGAYHAAEITHVFGTRLPWLPWEPVDDQLSAAMAKYWVAFAATGKPAVEGLPTWPTHDAAGDRYLELGPAIEAKAGLKKSACDVLDSVYPRLWGPAR
jgi:para-nitrobenzyl esterase